MITEDQRVLKATILNLPPDARDCFLLARFAGMTFDDIAERFGMSPEEVRRHLAEALRQIMQAILPAEA